MTSVQAQAIAAARQHDHQHRPSATSQAALTGATLAFSKPSVKPRPAPKPRQLASASTDQATALRSTKIQKNENGASPSRKSSLSSRNSAGSTAVSTHSTGNSLSTSRNTSVDDGNALRPVNLRAPSFANTAKSPHSPSNLAANLAASRLSPRPQITSPHLPKMSNEMSSDQKQDTAAVRKIRARQASISRRASEPSLGGVDGSHGSSDGTDATSILPTKSVVNMFEQSGGRPAPVRPETPGSPAWQNKRPAQILPSKDTGTGPQESAAARKLRARQASISRRRDDNPQHDNFDYGRTSDATDASSIAPTSSLVRAFEQGALAQSQKTEEKSESRLTSNATIGIRLAKAEPVPRAPVSLTDPVKPITRPKPSMLRTNSDTAQFSKPSFPGTKPSTTKVALEHSKTGSSDSSTYASAPETVTKPTLPPPRRGRGRKPANDSVRSTIPSVPISIPRSQSSHASFLQNRQTSTAKSISPSPPSSLGPRPPYLQPKNYSQTSMRQISPHMSGSSIANAIVAASLSSRTPSPNPQPSEPSPPPLLPPRMEPRHHHLPFSHRRTRTTSPPKKGLRTTMREDPSSSDSDDDDAASNPHKRHRHRIVRKHPHKHHEGDRLRWRSTITAAERKRYEGVFASNKGLLLPPPPPPPPPASGEEARVADDEVHGFVVREIWSRSRLARDCLREIWDLVAGQGGAIGLDGRTGRGRLRREEFVVGMWLIDQRLKGRKLPIKVGESVWASVRGVGGLVVPKAKRK